MIGAFDQRIALTMPIESGSGGAPIFRGIPGETGAQPLSSAYGEQPWLGDAFGSFTGNPTTLPVDTHEMVAMVAPRGLFIVENPHIDWLAARSGSVAALAGAEVYKALGAADNITYWSDIQDGTHCAVRPEWRTPLQQNIQKFLLRTGTAPGTIRISPKKAGNLSEWRDWQTPTLSDGPPTTTVTTTTTTTATTTTTTPAPNPTVQCRVTYDMSTWDTGLTANIAVTNTGGGTVNDWAFRFTLPTGQTITSGWNATYSPNSGQVTATSMPHNASMPPGGTVTFGFQATHTGNTDRPASFTLNDNTCATA